MEENKNIKVSFIIPVYKVEKYLEKCLNSVINQTLQNIEIICINDGSPDNSLEILNRYKEKYNNTIPFKIINKKNEGVWKARIDGIRYAEGEYTAIIDSDDYISSEYAEKLYNSASANNSDITIGGFQRVESTTGHIYSTEMNKFGKKTIEMNKNPYEILSINTALWNKLFRTSILKQVETIDKPPRILEDMMYIMLVYKHISKITFINDVVYFYNIREGSAITTIKDEESELIETSLLKIKNKYSNENNELLQLLDSMAFIHYGISYMFRVYSNKKTNFKDELKRNRRFLNINFPYWKKTKYLKLIYCIKHKTNSKIAIMKKVYKYYLLNIFMLIYSLLINKLKIDIKW